MSKFLAENLSRLEAYVPGEQPQGRSYIKLNTNESPFPPSPSVVEAITDEKIKSLRLYCDPTCNTLKEKISEVYKTQKDNVFVGNGSDEILNFIFMAYGQKGVAYADITYGFYSVFAELYNIESTVIPLKEDFSLDYKKFCNQNKLIVIASPNAPTGIEVTTEQLEEILKSNKDSVIVVDQAYVDFGGESAIKLIDKYDNLLVTQTFSKSRSMAGARLGFGVASEKIIQDLNTVKYSTNPYNVNRATSALGIGAIKDDKYFVSNCNKIIKNREFLTEELKKLGFTFTNSSANFVFTKSDKINGKELYLKLKEKGVLVRHFDKERISNYLRITIGSLDETVALINAVKEILGEIK